MSINPKRAVERCQRLLDLGPPPPLTRPWKLRLWRRAYQAIMALDISEVAELLRDVYTREDMDQLMNQPNPMFAMVRRDADPKAAK